MTGGQLAQFLLYAGFVGSSGRGALRDVGRDAACGRCHGAARAAPRRAARDRRPRASGGAAAARARRDPLRERELPLSIATGERGTREFQPGRDAWRDSRRSSDPRARARARRFSCCCASTIRMPGAFASTTGDSSDLRPKDIRAQIGLVPQDTVLFGASARENIRYGRPDASDAEIEAAAVAAAADEFLRETPAGLRHVPRRARHAAFGRATPAHRSCARHPQESADSVARRGHELARRGVGTSRAAGARAAHAGAHHHHHRAPAGHGAEGRPNRGHGSRPQDRRGHACRAFARLSPLCAACLAAVRRHRRARPSKPLFSASGLRP